jgi:hypothetical protein
MITSSEVVKRIAELNRAHPVYGDNSLEGDAGPCRPAGVDDHGAEDTQRQGAWHPPRVLPLERTNADPMIKLSPEKVAFLTKLSPSFGERNVKSERPGQLLSVDTFMVDTFTGLGSSRGGRNPRLPHLRRPERLYAARSDRGCASQRRPAFLCRAPPTNAGRSLRQRPAGPAARSSPLRALLGAERHRAVQSKLGSPHANGFVERFNGMVLEQSRQPACAPSST